MVVGLASNLAEASVSASPLCDVTKCLVSVFSFLFVLAFSANGANEEVKDLLGTHYS